MRYKQYINESTDSIYDILSDISKDCKPFLKEWLPIYKRTKEFLYRGMDENTNFGSRKVRKNRYPMSTPKALHLEIDKLMYDAYKIHGRSQSIFCTFNLEDAYTYGEPMAIFPIGEYKYLWADFGDLYLHLARMSLSNDPDFNIDVYDRPSGNEQSNRNTSTLKKLIKRYHTGSLGRAASTDSEVMVQCKQYYYISMEMLDTLEDYFDNI